MKDVFPVPNQVQMYKVIVLKQEQIIKEKKNSAESLNDFSIKGSDRARKERLAASSLQLLAFNSLTSSACQIWLPK